MRIPAGMCIHSITCVYVVICLCAGLPAVAATDTTQSAAADNVPVAEALTDTQPALQPGAMKGVRAEVAPFIFETVFAADGVRIYVYKNNELIKPCEIAAMGEVRRISDDRQVAIGFFRPLGCDTVVPNDRPVTGDLIRGSGAATTQPAGDTSSTQISGDAATTSTAVVPCLYMKADLSEYRLADLSVRAGVFNLPEPQHRYIKLVISSDGNVRYEHIGTPVRSTTTRPIAPQSRPARVKRTTTASSTGT